MGDRISLSGCFDTHPTRCVAIDTRLSVWVAKETGATAYVVELNCCEHRYWDDDPRPDIIDITIGKTLINTALPALFGAIDTWLQEHHLRALPHTWCARECGGTTGYDLVLEADALPVRPISAL